MLHGTANAATWEVGYSKVRAIGHVINTSSVTN